MRIYVEHHVYKIDKQIIQQRHVAGDETLGQREHQLSTHFVQKALTTPAIRKRHENHAHQRSWTEEELRFFFSMLTRSWSFNVIIYDTN